jgi:hypothetical protein
MSAPVIQTPKDPITREQAITDIIESIALEETGLAHIINAEGEKIQKGKELACNVEELVTLNASVKDTLTNIIKIQMLLQFKLEEIAKFIPKKEPECEY